MTQETVINRRAFFRHALKKTGEAVVREADRQAEALLSRWILPPYAGDRLNFLLACTRCSDCIDACPETALVKLPVKLGARLAGLPVMNLNARACRLCDDWPCVAACENQALKKPPTDQGVAARLPRLARARISRELCITFSGPECGACAGSCPQPGALDWDMTRPFIDPGQCVGCGLCRQACITDPKAISLLPLNDDIEAGAPSGND